MTSKLRICAEKFLPQEENVVNQMYHKGKAASKLRAAFLSKKLWEDNSTITVGFFGANNTNLDFTPLEILQRDPNMDPIEKEIRELSPPNAVMKVIQERIQPIVGLNIEFVQKNLLTRTITKIDSKLSTDLRPLYITAC